MLRDATHLTVYETAWATRIVGIVLNDLRCRAKHAVPDVADEELVCGRLADSMGANTGIASAYSVLELAHKHRRFLSLK